MLQTTRCVAGICVAWVMALAGCGSVAPTTEPPTGLAAEVAAKAQQVAQDIGGTNGFGGQYMMGYYGGMPAYMGFPSDASLADPHAMMGFQLTNNSANPCTFHLAYLQSSAGLDQQTVDITVQPGETITTDLPCAEIVGVGSLTAVGAAAADLAGGTTLGNSYCVPGFLNSDFACGGRYGCVLTPDVDDLDHDGDTQELIVVTTGMLSHMGPGMGQYMINMMNGIGGFNGMMGGSFNGGPGGGMMSGFRNAGQ